MHKTVTIVQQTVHIHDRNVYGESTVTCTRELGAYSLSFGIHLFMNAHCTCIHCANLFDFLSNALWELPFVLRWFCNWLIPCTGIDSSTWTSVQKKTQTNVIRFGLVGRTVNRIWKKCAWFGQQRLK